MKKAALFLIILISALDINAANIQKQFKNLIENYDVSDEAKSVEKNSPAVFWSVMKNTNELYTRFTKDLKKNKGAEKEALERTLLLPRFYPQYDDSIVESMQGFCDTLLINMGIAELNLNCSLHMIKSDEINAFTALTEDDGFAMCFTTSLFNKKGMTYDILQGIIAHEFAHGILRHHIRSIYAVAKERRKNELIGAIAAGLNGFAAGYEAATYGTATSNNYSASISDINIDIKVSTLKFSLGYSREQEYEADLIAYRFLENLGRGEDYINALRVLGSAYDVLYSEYFDHPNITARIEFLKFVRDNPQIGNTINIRLKNKRIKANNPRN